MAPGRAALLLAGATRPHELLQQAADAVRASRSGTEPAGGWQRTAALEIVAGELAGEGARIDPRTVVHLTRDPDGVLVALAELTAHLFRLHDGEGAPAVVRALAPA